METLTTAQKIERLEKELAELRDKDRIEREAAYKKAVEERDNDLLALMREVERFNKKHNEKMILRDRSGESFITSFPFL